jgi:hypothetical protein
MPERLSKTVGQSGGAWSVVDALLADALLADGAGPAAPSKGRTVPAKARKRANFRLAPVVLGALAVAGFLALYAGGIRSDGPRDVSVGAAAADPPPVVVTEKKQKKKPKAGLDKLAAGGTLVSYHPASTGSTHAPSKPANPPRPAPQQPAPQPAPPETQPAVTEATDVLPAVDVPETPALDGQLGG